jgi:hypothetical protein
MKNKLIRIIAAGGTAEGDKRRRIGKTKRRRRRRTKQF